MTHHVLITGVSTGIGFATARLLHTRGLAVTGGVRTDRDTDRLTAEIGCRLIRLDVTAPEDIANAARTMAGLLAPGDTLSLVNNAGIAVGGPVEAIPMEEYRHQFDVNVLGLLAVTQALLPHIRETKGRVVNISSIGGRVASPFLSPYAASKFAVEAISDSLRREVAPFRVKVVSINPGVITTPIWEKSIDLLEERYLDPANEAAAPYKERLARMREMTYERVKNGAPASAVAEAVLEGLTSSRPKTRYYVGKGVGMTALMARLLPDRLIDRTAAKRLSE